MLQSLGRLDLGKPALEQPLVDICIATLESLDPLPSNLISHPSGNVWGVLVHVHKEEYRMIRDPALFYSIGNGSDHKVDTSFCGHLIRVGDLANIAHIDSALCREGILRSFRDHWAWAYHADGNITVCNFHSKGIKVSLKGMLCSRISC